jgi:hypothetical protein
MLRLSCFLKTRYLQIEVFGSLYRVCFLIRNKTQRQNFLSTFAAEMLMIESRSYELRQNCFRTEFISP